MTNKLKRRKVLLGLGGLAIAGTAYRYWPEDGFRNPCLLEPLPEFLLGHELVQSAWEGIDPASFRDCHVHLIGTGDSGSGLWVNPDMESLKHPVQWLQRAFYLNASCTADDGRSDLQYVERLAWLLDQMPGGVKLMLLAFDYFHNEAGKRISEASAFYTPGEYAASLARQHPDRFEWVASIHPYRPDAVAALRDAAGKGARAVKWLPPAQGMDPASPLWMTAHGFRGMASGQLHEMGWDSLVIELQLAHSDRNQTRAAYNASERLEERRKMMKQWADRLDSLEGNVVSMRA